jgi:hypothetical protein
MDNKLGNPEGVESYCHYLVAADSLQINDPETQQNI